MSLTIVEKKSSSEGDSGARKERRAECRVFFGGFVAIFAICPVQGLLLWNNNPQAFDCLSAVWCTLGKVV